VRAEVSLEQSVTRIEGPLVFLKRRVEIGLNSAVEVLGCDGRSRVGRIAALDMETIVVEVNRQKAHPLYRRVVNRSKKFYAHDEEQTAHAGDLVRIEETRPLSRLKRWTLKEIVKRSKLAIAAGKDAESGEAAERAS